MKNLRRINKARKAPKSQRNQRKQVESAKAKAGLTRRKKKRRENVLKSNLKLRKNKTLELTIGV